MTTPDAPHERLRSHLEATASHLDVAAAPTTQLKDRAAQRRARYHRAVSLGVITVAAVVVIGGVSALSRSTPSSVITSSEPGGEVIDGSVPVDQVPDTGPVASTATGAPAVVAPSAALPLGSDTADPFGELGLPIEVDPAFVWKVVDPGKEASISGTFSGPLQGSFPSFAVSTAPGRSNDYDNIETFLYRSVDGISWTRTAAQSPFAAGYWNAQVSGDQVFVTGTMPGIARTEANPLQIAAGRGDDWKLAELPVDTNADPSLPMVTLSDPQVTSAPYGDGVLVVVSEEVYPDYEALTSALGMDRGHDGFIDQRDDGVILADANCLQGANGSHDAASDLFGPADGVVGDPYEPMLEDLQDGDDFMGCPVTTKTWAELGLPPESVAALLTPTSRFFTVSADLDVEEIDPPDVGSFHTVRSDRPIVEANHGCCSDVASARFELTDGSWVELPPMENPALARYGLEFHDLGDIAVGLFGTTNDGRVPFMSVAADGSTRGVDLQGVLATEAAVAESWAEHAATTDDLWVGAVQTFADPVAEGGGIELTFGDVIVRQESQRSRFDLLDAATRQPIDRSLVSGDDNGNIEVRGPGGEVRATFHAEEVYVAMSPTADELVAPGHSIVTTADGASFSVESVAGLLGLDDADVSRVARVSSDGNGVLVTVALTERYADGTGKQLVLVGTPIG